jgi:hypothetical protein
MWFVTARWLGLFFVYDVVYVWLRSASCVCFYVCMCGGAGEADVACMALR